MPTVVNCKEAAVHLQPPKPTPHWICLLTRIWTVLRTWDRIKVVVLQLPQVWGEECIHRWYWKREWSAGGSGREGVSQWCAKYLPGWRGWAQPCRLQLGVKGDKERGKRSEAGTVSVLSQVNSGIINSPASDEIGSSNLLAGGKTSWSVISSFRCLMIHSLPQGRYLGVPTWTLANINPSDVPFHGFSPPWWWDLPENLTDYSVWNCCFDQQTSKFQALPRTPVGGDYILSTFIPSLFFPYIFLSLCLQSICSIDFVMWSHLDLNWVDACLKWF